MRREDGCASRAAGPDFDPEDLAGLPADEMTARALEAFGGRIALVSSFGAASVVLLDMVARVDPATPVVFLETGKLFAETLAYRDAVTARLGLRDVRAVRPEEAALAARDPDGTLHARDVDGCCAVRKVEPLERALGPFEAWITGRRQGQTASRTGLSPVERDAAGRWKINPLAGWSRADVARRMAERKLPEHPLVARGYPSIGCAPCTTPVAPGEDERAGRWRGSQREECGIHFVDGRIVRTGPPAADAA